MRIHFTFAALTFLALSMACLVPANGQETPAKTNRKLVVAGSATIYAKADTAYITFQVTSTEGNVKNARAENDKQVKKVKEGLAALKYPNVDIQVVPSGIATVAVDTANLQVIPGGVPVVPPAPNRQAQSTFRVTVREKDDEKLRDMVCKLADVAAENGGTGSGNVRGNADSSLGPDIQWSCENSAEARREAIKKAVDDALANAQAAVGKAQISVVEIHVPPQIDRTDTSRDVLYTQLLSNSPTPDSNLIPVTVVVEVTCSY